MNDTGYGAVYHAVINFHIEFETAIFFGLNMVFPMPFAYSGPLLVDKQGNKSIYPTQTHTNTPQDLKSTRSLVDIKWTMSLVKCNHNTILHRQSSSHDTYHILANSQVENYPVKMSEIHTCNTVLCDPIMNFQHNRSCIKVRFLAPGVYNGLS